MSAWKSFAEYKKEVSPLVKFRWRKCRVSFGNRNCPLTSVRLLPICGGSVWPLGGFCHSVLEIASAHTLLSSLALIKKTLHYHQELRNTDLCHVWGGSTAPVGKGTGFLCFQPNWVLRLGFGTKLQELCLQKPLGKARLRALEILNQAGAKVGGWVTQAEQLAVP